MHITRYTDYSLRVLMYAALKENELSTISEIATHYAISKNHLMKVVQDLNNRGYIKAIRGKHGGIRLSRPASEISIGAVVRETEQDLALVECFKQDNACVLTPACELKFIFNEALEGFFAVLDRYTLEDLIPQKNRPQLLKIFNLRAPL